MIATVVKTLQPRVIIYTYEGHGWERIVAETAHNLAIPAHVIGYQLAVLFPETNHFITITAEVQCLIIFLLGDVTRDILARNMKFCQGQITASGQIKHRHQKCIQAPMEYAFLPEGTTEEVHIGQDSF